jgi:hypothetical protein
MISEAYDDTSPSYEGATVGFRVAEVSASVPEPGTAAVAIVGTIMGLGCNRHRALPQNAHITHNNG